MAKSKKKHEPKPYTLDTIAERVRAALRSILRDWKRLSRPLPTDPIPPRGQQGSYRFRVRGAESYEELQEEVLQFAGRVWQLKDGLIRWLKTRLQLRLTFTHLGTGQKVSGSGGTDAKRTIEDIAKMSLQLQLCADLYNTHKHYEDCDRSKYQPLLTGVRYQSAAGGMAFRYDGTRKEAEILTAEAGSVSTRIEVHSGTHNVNFGDAVVLVGQAFRYWLPIILRMELLVPGNPVDRSLLEDLASFDAEVNQCELFVDGDTGIDIARLTADQQALAVSDPAALLAILGKERPSAGPS